MESITPTPHSERTPALLSHARHASLSRGHCEGLSLDPPKAQTSAPITYSAAPLATIDINGLSSSRFIDPVKRRLAYRDTIGRVNLALVQNSLDKYDEHCGDEEAHKLKLQAWARHARHAIASRPADESQTLEEMVVEHAATAESGRDPPGPLPISMPISLHKPRQGGNHQHLPDETVVILPAVQEAGEEDDDEEEEANLEGMPQHLATRYVSAHHVMMQRRLFDAPRPGDEPSSDTFYLRTLEAKVRRCPSIGSDEDDVYEVEEILKEDKATGRFLIRWEGFGPQDDTWEPEANIAPPLVLAFRHRRDVRRDNAGDDCMLGRVKMLWCASCAEHQPADSFSANQRRLTPSLRSCLNHHYRVSSGARGTPPHSTSSVYATPNRSLKRTRDDTADGSPAPPALAKRGATRPIARELSSRYADLEVTRCRLYGVPTTL